MLIDFHGDMLDSALTELGANTYDIREKSEYELSPKFKDITPLRASSDFVESVALNFSFGKVQIGKLKEIILDAYRKKGISDDTSSWSNEMTFEEVEKELLKHDEQNIQNIRSQMIDTVNFKLFSGTKRISIEDVLNGGITHIKVTGLPENLRFLFSDLFLRKILYSLQAMGPSRGFRLFVVDDEAKLLTAKKDDIKAVLNKYTTEMRKFGVGLILSSQLIEHFDDEILGNVETKLCMKPTNEQEVKKNKKYFKVESHELLKLEKGEGVLLYGDKKRKVKVIPLGERK